MTDFITFVLRPGSHGPIDGNGLANPEINNASRPICPFTQNPTWTLRPREDNCGVNERAPVDRCALGPRLTVMYDNMTI